MTCGLAQRPEYRDLMTAASKLTGERVNRSTHNHSVRGGGRVLKRELLRQPRM
ncbi:hypothetical protein M5E87_10930 [Flavonifractor plautii]|nr:hypothetical protein M5E87_10930 [Flavonifractor plautii]